MINIRETLAEAKYYRGLRRKWRSAKDVPSLGRLGARNDALWNALDAWAASHA
jgi:hypothetical protein